MTEVEFIIEIAKSSPVLALGICAFLYLTKLYREFRNDNLEYQQKKEKRIADQAAEQASYYAELNGTLRDLKREWGISREKDTERHLEFLKSHKELINRQNVIIELVDPDYFRSPKKLTREPQPKEL